MEEWTYSTSIFRQEFSNGVTGTDGRRTSSASQERKHNSGQIISKSAWVDIP
jgi:hypothetical protein